MENYMETEVVEKHYPVLEEIANSVTHGIGAVLSVAGLVWLIVRAVHIGDMYSIVSVIIFGSSLFLLYLASTLYHAIPWPNVKRVLRKFDHCAIYWLIAGTYTPFMLVSMRGTVGWTMFGVLWGIACVGTAFKLFFIGRFDKIATFMYVAMGWIALVAIKPIITYVPSGALIMMLIGGIAYTAGVFFYMNSRIPYNHAIWHCFVMAGSALHFFAIIYYVLAFPMG
jgi:hemolysin III